MGGYSTGMKQRVKLAQALVHGPRLLLLDEPTNGLDPAGRDEMLALVRRTGTEFGIAVIVASHLLGEIERVCDYLVAIDAGRLLRAAPLGTFTERTGVLAVEVEEGRVGARRGPRRARAARRGRRPDGPRRDHRGRPVRHRPGRGRGPRRSRSSGSSSAARASRTCSATTSRSRAELRVRRRPRIGRRRPPAGAVRHERVDRSARRRRPDLGQGTGRQHLRPGLSGVPRAAPRTAKRRGRPVHADAPLELRDRPGRSGQDRAVRARRAGDPPRRAGGRHRIARRPGGWRGPRRCVADPVRDLSRPGRRPGHAVLRRPGAGAVRA